MAGPDLVERDLRLDLFRAASLWLLFLEQLPSANPGLMNIRVYGFGDATAIFIFVFGYTAGLVYGQVMRERGVFVAAAQIVRRAWQVYVAHVFLFVFHVVEMRYMARDNPGFPEDTNVKDLLEQPAMALAQGLFLNFQPSHTEVLALYVALLLAFPPMLFLLRRSPILALAASASLYVLARERGWNLPAFPAGVWPLNPFAWQLLFGLGAWFGLHGTRGIERVLGSRIVVGLAAGYLMLALIIAIRAYVPELGAGALGWLDGAIYPIDRTDVDLVVMVHVLSIAVIAVRVVPQHWSALRGRALRPVLLCGRYSLPTLCLGVFLSFGGRSVFALSNALATHIGVAIGGVALMVALALFLDWFETVSGSGPRLEQATRSASRPAADL